ncbi:ABC transporter permease [Aeoliella sp. ICT_H6.2]|uniref:Transport permease protein n=1 Tax=Aeoliella straminimaris TaxID=2954799 RepID=A0A9X2JGY8_9BACT|nr:ABC transporter permease [Aeoliella straminimaris]MCO6045505.1 ABC transporter permease [Aeoliella straminimaris]
MSSTTLETRSVPVLPAIATLAWRELVRFFRQRTRVFGALGQPIIFWLMFSEGFKAVDLGYAYQFPGILAMILLFTAIFTTISIIEDRNEGFLQGVLVSPVPRWAMVVGKVTGGAIIAWLQALLFLLLGWATISEIRPPVAGVLAALAMMMVIAIALTGLGFYLAWRTDSSQGYHAMMSVLLFPMWLLSGSFFPVHSDSVIGWLVMVNPLTYGVAGLRHYLDDGKTIDNGWLPGLGLSWGVTIAFALVMLALSTRVVETRTQGDLK